LRTSLDARRALKAGAIGVLAWCCGRGAVADPPTAPESTAPAAPTGNFFSSLKQALKQDLNYEVVRGHFDVGSPPATHRFYCLIDPRNGKSEEYAVAGETFLRPDGMTGIKAGAVSPDSCAKAEEQGILVTTGYVLKLAANTSAAAKPPAPLVRSPSPSPSPSPKWTVETSIDVAGIELGMSTDQVRAILKSKLPSDYYESTGTLPNVDQSSGRFINLIEAWTAAQSGGESYKIMFTPVPGRERAMAIVHAVKYSTAEAPDWTSLQSALVTKYGGYTLPADLPESPTWRLQSGGNMLTGDTCERRGLLDDLVKAEFGDTPPQNLALRTTSEEFRLQTEQCGVAIVTEDHVIANRDASPQDRIIAQFTVTAYSPSICLEGATTAMQVMRTAGVSAVNPQSTHSRQPPRL
jgi:hypothetical protein